MNNYQTMCREAKEIRERWERKYGDLYSLYGHKPTVYTTARSPNRKCEKDKIWLPRIEDLVEMLFKGFVPASPKQQMGDGFPHALMIQGFADFYWRNVGLTGEQPEIVGNMLMNEGWLAFTMDRLYSKSWNGSTWEKSD